jgi:Tol biopolymer transport system component
MITTLVILSCVIGCEKTITVPEIDLDDEAALVPWSKITGKIAYSRYEYRGEGSCGYLFIIDADSQKVRLVKEDEDIYFWDVVFHPDGSELMYVSIDELDEHQLYTIDPYGRNIEKAFSGQADRRYPAYSSDGRLAYWYGGAFDNRSQVHEVFIDNAPFFDKVPCILSRPAWSPDNEFLVVVSGEVPSDGKSLYRVNLNDTTFTELLPENVSESMGFIKQPAYSPDGSKIAFTVEAVESNTKSVWVMDSDGSNLVRLTWGRYDSNPAWSPDGSKIAFTRDAINGNIHIMNADGSDITQVTKNRANHASWIE